MKSYISRSIIMRSKEFGETDLLVTYFTLDKGRLKGVAKGARKSRKRFANCLDLFCLVDLEYSLKREGGLYFLNSGKLINAYPGLRSDFAILSKASYMVELTEILFPLGVADRNMFELLRGSLASLSKGERIDIISILFEVRAMALGGYAINFDRCSICGRPYKGEGRAVFRREKGGIACIKCQQESAVSPGIDPQTVKMIKLMQTKPLTSLAKLKDTDEIVREIKPVLKLHREYHLGQRPKTASYLE
ncbi:MAG: DNA repair protein RecO [Deltaproteobacteria bacterium]|nr:MAG: DNA repair protein RecO [Deltaproteobacteria bacterium]